jgi:uncharacterized protein YigE (DUF2233 family)
MILFILNIVKHRQLNSYLYLIALTLQFLTLQYFFALDAYSQPAQTTIENPDSTSAVWKPSKTGLDISQVEITSKLFFTSQITLLRFKLEDYRLAVIRATDFGSTRGMVKNLCEKAHAVACINASFFDESGKPLGLVVTRGMTLQNIHKRGGTLTGIFQVSRSDASIVNRAEYNPESIVEAIQAGPRLISNSEKIPGLKEENSARRRSGVCIDNSKRVIFYTMSTGLFGLSLDDLREFLLSESIGCKDALNLDGGGSSQLFAKLDKELDTNKNNELSIEGTDEVPIILGILPK